jgi:predicted Zn-ribbon and HTH transcriptional regulator
VTDFGYRHKTNALKFRILEALVWSKEPLTVRDIESKTGIYHTKINCAMSHYQKIVKQNGKIIKLPYIQRLEKKGPNELFRYKITKPGIQ